MAYGELAGELIRDLARAKDNVPAYDGTAVREILEEAMALSNKNRDAIASTAMEQLIGDTSEIDNVSPEDRTIYANVCIRWEQRHWIGINDV